MCRTGSEATEPGLQPGTLTQHVGPSQGVLTAEPNACPYTTLKNTFQSTYYTEIIHLTLFIVLIKDFSPT